MLSIYVPLTTQNRGSRYEVDLGKLPFLHHASVANVQGVGSLAEVRLLRKLGWLRDHQMQKVREALRFALEL